MQMTNALLQSNLDIAGEISAGEGSLVGGDHLLSEERGPLTSTSSSQVTQRRQVQVLGVASSGKGHRHRHRNISNYGIGIHLNGAECEATE